MEWKEVRLLDVAEYISKKIDINMINLKNYISTENMLPNKEGITLASSLPSTQKVNSFIVGDTLFSNIRTYFKKVWIASFNGGVSNDVLVIRSKDDEVLFDKFLYYVVSNDKFIDYTVSTSKGTKMPRGDKNAIMNYKFKLPPLPIQKKIAHILSTLDDKIELNRKMNKTLEAMAQAIFKSWFVDFDPVHAKARAKTQAELEIEAKKLGITPEILELFPSEFEESELGMIPKGWEVSTIGEEFKVTMGQSPSGTTYNEEGNGVIFFQGRRDFGDYYPIPRVYTTDPKRMAKEGDILLSVRAPVGDINIAMERCCIGRGLAALRHKSNAVCYSYLVLKNLYNKFNGYDTEGTVFGSINQKNLKDLKIIKNDTFIKFFSDIAEPIFEQIKKNVNEIQTLQKTRDTLLPKLLSGELDVSEVEI